MSHCTRNLQFAADLVKFTEEIFDGKLQFLYSVCVMKLVLSQQAYMKYPSILNATYPTAPT